MSALCRAARTAARRGVRGTGLGNLTNVATTQPGTTGNAPVVNGLNMKDFEGVNVVPMKGSPAGADFSAIIERPYLEAPVVHFSGASISKPEFQRVAYPTYSYIAFIYCMPFWMFFMIGIQYL